MKLLGQRREMSDDLRLEGGGGGRQAWRDVGPRSKEGRRGRKKGGRGMVNVRGETAGVTEPQVNTGVTDSCESRGRFNPLLQVCSPGRGRVR